MCPRVLGLGIALLAAVGDVVFGEEGAVQGFPADLANKAFRVPSCVQCHNPTVNRLPTASARRCLGCTAFTDSDLLTIVALLHEELLLRNPSSTLVALEARFMPLAAHRRQEHAVDRPSAAHAIWLRAACLVSWLVINDGEVNLLDWLPTD